jgi:hypothetical protein
MDNKVHRFLQIVIKGDIHNYNVFLACFYFSQIQKKKGKRERRKTKTTGRIFIKKW